MRKFVVSRRYCVLMLVVLVVICAGTSTLKFINTQKSYGYRSNTPTTLTNGLATLSDLSQRSHHEPEEPTHLTNKTWDVLISTYMRSGSSFLGSILGWRNDSFYWYEPLWMLHTWKFLREDGRLCSYRNTDCTEIERYTNKSWEKAFGFLKDVYRCNLANHSRLVNERLQALPRGSGHSWDSFYQCRKENNTIAKCLSLMESTCLAAKHRVTKVLRMDFAYMGDLLLALPQLKVVLLLRDPRAILNSHLHTRWFPVNLQSLEEDAKVLCPRMERDLQAASHLMERFKDRVKIVQYEDLGESYEKANLLYQFLGMSFLDNNTFATLNTRHDKNQGKNDPFSYRTFFSWDNIQMIDRHCSTLYDKLGIVRYKDLTHLRNRTMPSVSDKLPYALS